MNCPVPAATDHHDVKEISASAIDSASDAQLACSVAQPVRLFALFCSFRR